MAWILSKKTTKSYIKKSFYLIKYLDEDVANVFFFFGQLKCRLCYHGIVFDVCFPPSGQKMREATQTRNSELIYRLENRRRFLEPCLPPVSVCWRCWLR
ncbi:hypothetical protein ACNKHN_20775 [Shigella flexneri]